MSGFDQCPVDAKRVACPSSFSTLAAVSSSISALAFLFYISRIIEIIVVFNSCVDQVGAGGRHRCIKDIIIIFMTAQALMSAEQ